MFRRKQFHEEEEEGNIMVNNNGSDEGAVVVIRETMNHNHNNHHHHHHHHDQSCNSRTSTSRSTGDDSSAVADPSNSKWAAKLLVECAVAISQNDSPRIHHLLWMLNELSSPYGDSDQKLASYFLHALFCKVTHSGLRSYNTLNSHSSHSFDSARKLILKFQEVSPWTTFGHVAANGAILEALDGESNLHIIDISNTLCTQWPTLLEALATRNDDTPRLKLTVVLSSLSIAGANVMKEVRQRMDKFARLMGVPFQLNVVTISGLRELSKEALLGNDEDDEGEALAINCVGALRRVEVEERAGVIRMFKSLNPRVVTVVEEHADFTTTEFVKGFEECLSFFTLYFDMLEESFPATSHERLMLERECSRSIVRVLACESSGSSGECESRERGKQWSERLKEEFCPMPFSDDVLDDVKSLLKRYRPGWSLSHQSSPGIYLNWKDQPLVWASAWKP